MRTDDTNTRRKLEALFGLDGGELSHSGDDWDGIVAWWLDGVPEELERHHHDLLFSIKMPIEGVTTTLAVRTVIADCLHGPPKAPQGWEQVEVHPGPKEVECPDCGNAENTHNLGHGGIDGCALCEGLGYIHYPGMAGVVYRQVAAPVRHRLGTEHGCRWHTVSELPIRCPNAGQYGTLASPGDLVVFKFEGSASTRMGRVMGRVTDVEAMGDQNPERFVGRLSVLMLHEAMASASHVWVDPLLVEVVRAPAPNFMRWFMQESLPPAPVVLALSVYGTLSEDYIVVLTCGPENLRGQGRRFIEGENGP